MERLIGGSSLDFSSVWARLPCPDWPSPRIPPVFLILLKRIRLKRLKKLKELKKLKGFWHFPSWIQPLSPNTREIKTTASRLSSRPLQNRLIGASGSPQVFVSLVSGIWGGWSGRIPSVFLILLKRIILKKIKKIKKSLKN